MFHKYKIYYFINTINTKELIKLDNKINLILRNYDKNINEKDLNIFIKFCKQRQQKIFLSNNIKLSLKLNFDGIYISAFNNSLKYKNFSFKKNFQKIGSAHNEQEILIKKNQGCSEIFISPLFLTRKNKSHLGISKFNKINLNNKKKIIALGGINSSNFKKLGLTNCMGFASISWIKKTGLKN